MSAEKTLSIVVPVYFNAWSLPRLFEELLKLEGNPHTIPHNS